METQKIKERKNQQRTNGTYQDREKAVQIMNDKKRKIRDACYIQLF